MSTQSISEAKLAANRTNAKKSTGPRTPEGKARASANARKHSFAGSDFTIIKIEDRDAIDRLRDDLIAAYAPQNSQELFAIERIALAQHNILRLARFESGLFNLALNRAICDYDNETPYMPLHQDLHVDAEDIKAQNRAYALATGFHQMVRESDRTWTLFLRYQSQAERHYRRAIEEFERLRKLRSVLPNEPFPDSDLPAEASAKAGAISTGPAFETTQNNDSQSAPHLPTAAAGRPDTAAGTAASRAPHAPGCASSATAARNRTSSASATTFWSFSASPISISMSWSSRSRSMRPIAVNWS